MKKRLDHICFPEGKKKALTLSYDDGVIQDRKLTELCNRYGIQCTFNLGSEVLGYQGTTVFSSGKTVDISKIEKEEINTLYAGQDIGGHGLYHTALNMVGTPLAVYEVIEDKRQLEEISGRLIRMFAYPFGTYSADTKEILRMSGYQGARTVRSTHSFEIPEDFLEWHPTCHHNDSELMNLAEKFCTESSLFSQLFYLWGHAYEFDADDNWDVLESFFKYLQPYRENIWFVSNTDFLDYILASRRLIYSADGSVIYNPSSRDLWISTGEDIIMLPSGKTTHISD